MFFGGPLGLDSIIEEENSKLWDINDILDMLVNIKPDSGTADLWTEESVPIALAQLCPILTHISHK